MLCCNSQIVEEVEKYEIKDKIGNGQFGDVYKAIRKSDGRVLAIKRSRYKNVLFMNELTFLRKLNYNYIIKLHDTFIKNDKHHLVLDYYDSGDLYDFIMKREFNENEIKHIIINLLKPILFLKQKKIVHLDLKIENFLVRDKIKFDFVLIDLGTCKTFEDEEKLYPLKCVTGTKIYVAPEIFDLKYCCKSDVWSFGQIIILFLTKCRLLYEVAFTQIEILDELKELRKKDYINMNCYKLLKKIFKIDPKRRIHLEDIFDSLWLEEYYLSEFNITM
jgi:serine/threonine protein kinase